MKDFIMILVMISVLGFGFMGAQPAKAIPGCWSICIYLKMDCFERVYDRCEGDQVCVFRGREDCNRDEYECLSGCGTCPL